MFSKKNEIKEQKENYEQSVLIKPNDSYRNDYGIFIGTGTKLNPCKDIKGDDYNAVIHDLSPICYAPSINSIVNIPTPLNVLMEDVIKHMDLYIMAKNKNGFPNLETEQHIDFAFDLYRSILDNINNLLRVQFTNSYHNLVKSYMIDKLKFIFLLTSGDINYNNLIDLKLFDNRISYLISNIINNYIDLKSSDNIDIKTFNLVILSELCNTRDNLCITLSNNLMEFVDNVIYGHSANPYNDYNNDFEKLRDIFIKNNFPNSNDDIDNLAKAHAMLNCYCAELITGIKPAIEVLLYQLIGSINYIIPDKFYEIHKEFRTKKNDYIY